MSGEFTARVFEAWQYSLRSKGRGISLLNRPSSSPLTRLTLNARGAGMLCERESSAAQGPPGIFRLLLIQQFLPLLGRSTIFGIVGFEWPMD